MRGGKRDLFGHNLAKKPLALLLSLFILNSIYIYIYIYIYINTLFNPYQLYLTLSWRSLKKFWDLKVVETLLKLGSTSHQ